jgi:hypothetical protein
MVKGKEKPIDNWSIQNWFFIFLIYIVLNFF